MKNKLFWSLVILLTVSFPLGAKALVADDITNAATGGTVEIDGVNTENLTINKSVTLKGSSTDKIVGDLTITGDSVNVVLDGFTIEGHINVVATNSKVTFKNMILDGKNTVEDNILVTIRALNSDITVDNTTFKGFIKAGIYAETLKNIDVTNSTFNAFGTANIGSLEDYVASNPEAHEIVRSGACIDLNFGNQSDVKFNLDNVSIVGNHFEGVRKFVNEDSTAGAVKVKFKNASNVTTTDNTSVTIGANEFVDNVDDVVIGTSNQPSTSDFLVAFYKNTSDNGNEIRVTNNGAVTAEKDVVDGSMVVVRNYKDSSNTDLNADFFIITINDEMYMVMDGATLKEAVAIDSEEAIDLDSFKVKDGYTFKYFVEAGTENVIDADTVITKSMTIEPVFEKANGTAIDSVKNPETSDGILIMFALLMASGALLVISSKKVLAK